uniref:Uncharacterized protein n=1 Tax=Rhipicephalus zambeziensis TaxID=60191 RepID=A0A224YAT3_9ACAR
MSTAKTLQFIRYQMHPCDSLRRRTHSYRKKQSGEQKRNSATQLIVNFRQHTARRKKFFRHVFKQSRPQNLVLLSVIISGEILAYCNIRLHQRTMEELHLTAYYSVHKRTGLQMGVFVGTRY